MYDFSTKNVGDDAIEATSSVRSLTLRNDASQKRIHTSRARANGRVHTYVKMPNSGNGDAPKFGGYLISLDGSLAGGRLNPRKERVQRESLLAVCSPYGPVLPRRGNPCRIARLALSPPPAGFTLILTTLGDRPCDICTRLML